MARYTPEFLATLRRRYEQTDQPMRALAAEFEIGISTLSSLVEKQGWAKRSLRQRDCPPTLREVLTQAEALAAEALPARSGGEGASPDASRVKGSNPSSPEQTLTPTLPLSGEGDTAALAAGGEPARSPAERLEALVVKEIAAEEAMRAELETRPRARGESERCARTLSVLTQTLHVLQRLRGGRPSEGEPNDYDDMPRDLDEFRRALARRIEAFVASRTDLDDAGEHCGSDRADEIG